MKTLGLVSLAGALLLSPALRSLPFSPSHAAPSAKEEGLSYFGYVEVPYQPVDVISRYAHDIIHGTVQRKSIGRIDSGFPCTHYEVAVHSSLRNRTGNRVVVSIAGSPGNPVHGAPTFDIGEEVVLFLTAPDDDGLQGVLGLDLGALHVRHAAGGATIASGRLVGQVTLEAFFEGVQAILSADSEGARK